MTPLTKFQRAVKLAAEECDIPKVIMYAEDGLGDSVSTSIWSTEAAGHDDFYWMRAWLDEQLYLEGNMSQWRRWWGNRPRWSR